MELTDAPGPDDLDGATGRGARPRRPWGAAAAGAAIGLLVATAGILVFELVGSRGGTEGPPVRETASGVDLFRLPSGTGREIFLLPAGPDASGEPRLAQALFPGEEPPRALAALVVANVGAGGAWELDLATTPLRGRAGAGPWETLEAVGGPSRRDRDLPADVELRLRGLGGAAGSVRLEPGTLGQILVALPRGRRVGDLSDVQLGEVALVRDRLDPDRVRRFRLDPAGTTSGR